MCEEKEKVHILTLLPSDEMLAVHSSNTKRSHKYERFVICAKFFRLKLTRHDDSL